MEGTLVLKRHSFIFPQSVGGLFSLVHDIINMFVMSSFLV